MSEHDDGRPSPDELLAEIARESRGRLKIFLGAAPGVGKTYAMLEAAHALLKEGKDIAAGVVETHKRQETEALLEGLELIPLQTLEYRGRSFPEMDLDGILERKPQLVLVDELAHTNIPGSRHLKRYQDVEEILEAGISVYATLNIQHLESVNDVVERIAGIKVRETLPDSVLQQADEIELIDLSPEDLLKRLSEGKVYVPEQAQRAKENFFSTGTLTALREMSLRHAAERVDAQMVGYMRAHAIAGPWPASERLMVCLDSGAQAERLVRQAKRAAERRQVPWIAVYVETAAAHRLPEESKNRLSRALSLAEQLGGETIIMQGDDPAVEILTQARKRNVTLILVERPVSTFRRRLFRQHSLAENLLRLGEGIDILLSGYEAVEGAAVSGHVISSAEKKKTEWHAYLSVIIGVVISVGLGHGLYSYLPQSSILLLFLLTVFLSAIRLGMKPAIFASVLGFFAFNFFLTEPRYTLAISDAQNGLALVFFLVVAAVVSNMANRLRAQVETTKTSAKRTATLYDFNRKIAASATRDDVLWVVVHHVALMVSGRSLVLLPQDGRLKIAAGYPPEDCLDEHNNAAAEWTWQHGEAAGRGSDTLPGSDWLFLPLKTARGIFGVLGVQTGQNNALLSPEQNRLLGALADQAAVAIERTNLVADIEAAKLMAEAERLRSAMLSSLSHDLQTPLIAIVNASNALCAAEKQSDAFDRRPLIQTIQEEADLMNRYVQNLLDMTRLGSGALKPRRDRVLLRDVVCAAQERAERLLTKHRVILDLSDDVPPLYLDFLMIEQVFFNLLDNAAKYAPPGTPITVWARPRRQGVVIEVCDEGPGIPKSEREAVFNMFYRTQGSQATGTGLGLAVCRGIVEAHGGTIRAEGGLHDVGTCILISLPIGEEDPEIKEEDPEESQPQ